MSDIPNKKDIEMKNNDIANIIPFLEIDNLKESIDNSEKESLDNFMIMAYGSHDYNTCKCVTCLEFVKKQEKHLTSLTLILEYIKNQKN